MAKSSALDRVSASVTVSVSTSTPAPSPAAASASTPVLAASVLAAVSCWPTS
ncbi:MAG: hypothetical protein M5U35_06935 [Roseovarius sp.]|nr:hypothetical protein [Roseovarius sp.]